MTIALDVHPWAATCVYGHRITGWSVVGPTSIGKSLAGYCPQCTNERRLRVRQYFVPPYASVLECTTLAMLFDANSGE